MSSPDLAAAERAVVEAALVWDKPKSHGNDISSDEACTRLEAACSALRRLRAPDPLQEARDLVAEYMANGSTAAPKLLALLDRAISARGGGQ